MSSGIWQGVGWGSIIYLAAIAGIDPSLYEAAKIDGAGRFKQIMHVTIPGIIADDHYYAYFAVRDVDGRRKPGENSAALQLDDIRNGRRHFHVRVPARSAPDGLRIFGGDRLIQQHHEFYIARIGEQDQPKNQQHEPVVVQFNFRR